MTPIWAAKETPPVGIVENGMISKSGCTPMVTFSMQGAFGDSTSNDNPKIHLEDPIRQ